MAYIDIFILSVLSAGMIYSPFLFTMALILMSLRIILHIGQGFYTHRFNYFSLFRRYDLTKILFFLLSFFVLNIVGLLWTENLGAGFRELNHKLPFLIIPLYVLCVCPFENKVLKFSFIIYLLLLGGGMIIGIFNYFTSPYTDGRFLIPHTRNISFAFQICFAIGVMTIYANRNRKEIRYILPIILFFIFYLFLASLLSGIVTLGVLFFCTLVYILRKKDRKYALLSILLFTIVLLISGYWLYIQINNYFSPKEPLVTHAEQKTQLGGTYRDNSDTFIENGYYVGNYCCPDEVNLAWEERTGLNITDFCEGKQQGEHFHYYDIIYRYLNSKGLRKDYQGVKSLTEKDIENIKQGFSNVVYAEGFSLKARLYRTFYEFECYSRTGEVENMSLIQRLIWSDNALKIIKQQPILGSGTGDVKEDLDRELMKTYPELCKVTNDPHNLLIYICATFGIVGLLYVIFVFVLAFCNGKMLDNKYFVLFVVICLCWTFCESFFERIDGMAFFSFLFSYFYLQKISYNNLLYNKEISVKI